MAPLAADYFPVTARLAACYTSPTCKRRRRFDCRSDSPAHRVGVYISIGSVQDTACNCNESQISFGCSAGALIRCCNNVVGCRATALSRVGSQAVESWMQWTQGSKPHSAFRSEMRFLAAQLHGTAWCAIGKEGRRKIRINGY